MLLPQQMHCILGNRHYFGIVTYGGVEYQGDHEPLIDEATWDTVDAIRTTRNLNRNKIKSRPHHLKGSIFCARCGRRLGITAPTKARTGKTYPYFYCLGRQRHTEGQGEVARQRKRLARLNHERTKAKTAYYDYARTLDQFKLEQERIGHEAKAAESAIAQWTIEIDAMRRALDEALSLLADPYRLYTEPPRASTSC